MRPLVATKGDAPRRRSKVKKKRTNRDAIFRLRLERAELEQWIACAEAEAYLSLSDWLRDLANNRTRSRPMNASGSEHWCTPPEILERVIAVCGSIGLDPCSNGSSIVGARTAWDVHADGLSRSWIGLGSVYVNPPYGDALPVWMGKCALEAAEGAEIVALVPARTETKWFRAVLESPATVGLWRGRVQFLGAPNPAPFPSVLIYWGPRADRFVEVCAADCNGFLRGS